MKGMLSLILPLLIPVSAAHGADLNVANMSRFTDTGLGITVVSGTVSLPPKGLWVGDLAGRGAVLEQVVLMPEAEAVKDVTGQRAEQANLEREIQASRNHVQRVWMPIFEYAEEHGGRSPASLEDLPERQKFLRDAIRRSPYGEDRDSGIQGPFLFVIPNVPVHLPQQERPPVEPLVLDLRPYVDDGRHWVLLNNGGVEYREIDHELLERYGLSVRPLRSSPTGAPEETPVRPYEIFALLRKNTDKTVRVTLADALTGEKVTVRWDLAAAGTGERRIVSAWAMARLRAFGPYLRLFDAGVIRYWLAAAREAYGLSDLKPLVPWLARPGRRMAGTFEILGGRAAVRETLQLQGIGGAGPEGSIGTEPVSELKGVDAPSHPFDEMLGEAGVKGLELADLVPPDRLFVYFSKPRALDAFLEEGTDFLFRSGALFTRRSIAYDLKPRYYRKLGVSEEWIRRFLDSGSVSEMAVTAPDLHFIDGTDITVICRVPKIGRLAPLLKLLGIVDLEEGRVTELDADNGRTAFWTRRDRLVIVSTHRGELDRVLAIKDAGGVGSLGRSAEFRYMLTKLPVRKETRTYAYFSDPFIRRLTGPELKIGQARRMAVRRSLEAVTAGALLRRLDTGEMTTDVGTLSRLGYVPAGLADGALGLREDLVATSAAWGTAADMAGLLSRPVTLVTEPEAAAYRSYVQNYNRFWRRYFDPIALRLDDAPDGALELSTFILPLVDNTIYEGVREALRSAEEGGGLKVPRLAGDTVLTLSLNLKEEFWVKLAGRFSRELTSLLALDPAIYDLLGPGLHVAVLDGDPIIATGSGDVLGAFSAQVVAGRDGLGFGLPLLLSILTRPTRILVELSDPEAALAILNRASVPLEINASRPRRPNSALRKLRGRDAWIYTLDLEGVIAIRFGLEVRDGFLVISNLPWSYPLAITEVRQAELSGAHMRVRPAATSRQLAALYTSAAESYQQASLQGMAYLYPLLLTVADTPADAALSHKTLFGFAPLHPRAGKWLYEDGTLRSTAYGGAYQWTMPAHTPGDRDFGLLRNVEDLEVNMQMEEDGLRSRVRWVWKGDR